MGRKPRVAGEVSRPLQVPLAESERERWERWRVLDGRDSLSALIRAAVEAHGKRLDRRQ